MDLMRDPKDNNTFAGGFCLKNCQAMVERQL